MFEESRDMSLLAEIKDHIDSHGFASAIVKDHVAIGFSNKTSGADSPGATGQKIVRVRSLDEACCVIGCCCMMRPH
ncbi:hypothetical protein [Hyphococcus sp.]|uniref:hypothetical protein n=1 Tax=Hyphococcus sp. TaxID=2038636 RepID=UPI0035C75B0A